MSKWGLLKKKKEAEVPSSAPATTKTDDPGKCQSVEYPGWGSGGHCDLPMPCQFGRQIETRKLAAEAVREGGHRGKKKLWRVLSSEPCRLLFEDMFWYIFLDEFSLEDHEGRVDAQRSLPDDAGTAPTPHPPRGVVPIRPTTRPAHLNNLTSRRALALVASKKETQPPLSTPLSRPRTPAVYGSAQDTDEGVRRVLALADASEAQSTVSQSHTVDANLGAFLTRAGVCGSPSSCRSSRRSRASSVCSSSSSVHSSVHSPVGNRSSFVGSGAFSGLDATEAKELVADEKEALYTRMSYHYVQLFKGIATSDKDMVLKDLPPCVFLMLRAAFERAVPYLKAAMGKEFRRNVLRRVSFWLTGVETSDMGSVKCVKRKRVQGAGGAGEASVMGKLTQYTKVALAFGDVQPNNELRQTLDELRKEFNTLPDKKDDDTQGNWTETAPTLPALGAHTARSAQTKVCLILT